MKRHLGVIIGVVVIAGAIAASSVLFASSDGTVAIAEDAAVQVRVGEVLGAVTVTRAFLSEAVLFGVAYRAQDVSEASFKEATADAASSLDQLDIRAQSLLPLLKETRPEITAAVDGYVAAATTLLMDLESGRYAAAEQSDLAALVETHDVVTHALAQERDERERHIAAVRAGVAEVADAARFAVAFLIPALAVIASLAVMRRRQEHMRIEAEYEQEQQVRAAKDEFLTAIAHELRTPLTAVVGFSETLRDRQRELSKDERDELMEILTEEAVTTASLLDDMLVFARANIGDLAIRLEVVSVRDLIERVAKSWGEHHHGRLTISGHGEVWADSLRLRQVIRNLLWNAFQHGGENVEVRIYDDGNNVQIEVADNGPGIPSELRSRIFDPYEHQSANHGHPASIGLGLTVARSLVRLMDGQLSYSFRNGESVFEVTLPGALPQNAVDDDGAITELRSNRPSSADLIDAIQQQQIHIVYQPIVDLQRSSVQKVVGLEALARFPNGSPIEWFAAASTKGIRLEFELAAIKAAIASFEGTPSSLFLALNASLETLVSPQLAEALDGISPDRVVLELSEDSVVDNYERTKVHLDQLKAKGYRLAVDDLAKGRIDLWHLVRIRPSIVKFDISLVRDIDLEPSKRALVNGLKWLADMLKSRIVAEGIERSEELEMLKRLGVHYGQGNLLARPAPLSDLDQLQGYEVLADARA